jgi:transglutaminase-like putative cysteine protease
MRYLIEHETRLSFPAPVKEHQIELRLTPPDDEVQRLHRMTLDVEPRAELFSYRDSFGNRVHAFSLPGPHEQVITRVQAEVETYLENPFGYVPVPAARERDWVRHSLRDVPRLLDYVLHRSATTPDLSRVGHPLDVPTCEPARYLIENVQAAMTWVREHLDYDPDATHAHSSLQEVLKLRAGVCQDFAHLLIAIVRGWGFPARYVMGYQDPGYFEDEKEPLKQATHAWTEVLIPGAGWRGFDATHGLVTNDTYVRVAVGRDHRDAAPQRGSFKGEAQGGPPEVRLRVSPQQ